MLKILLTKPKDMTEMMQLIKLLTSLDSKKKNAV